MTRRGRSKQMRTNISRHAIRYKATTTHWIQCSLRFENEENHYLLSIFGAIRLCARFEASTKFPPRKTTKSEIKIIPPELRARLAVRPPLPGSAEIAPDSPHQPSRRRGVSLGWKRGAERSPSRKSPSLEAGDRFSGCRGSSRACFWSRILVFGARGFTELVLASGSSCGGADLGEDGARDDGSSEENWRGRAVDLSFSGGLIRGREGRFAAKAEEMGSRFPSHQLSNGLYVSGLPEQHKERQPTMTSRAVPYTGGDVKKSGELGKMFDIPVVETTKVRKSGPVSGGGPSRAASFGATAGAGFVVGGGGSNSGPLPSNAAARSGSQKSNSGPLKKSSGPLSGGATPVARQNSGPLAPSLPATGLITSGPISSGPLSSSGAPRKASGPLESAQSSNKLNYSVSMTHGQSVTKLTQDEKYSFRKNVPRVILWTVIPLFVMGFIAGGFILAAVGNPILLIVVGGLFGAVVLLVSWNACWGERAVTGFLAAYPDAELRSARDGQYVKVTGVVTCGSVPLESSYQKVSRCVYVSTGLYEYRGWNTKPANPKHRRFTWGLRYLERHVADFYISDFQSGLRALVKTGYGARVTTYVDTTNVVDLTEKNRELSPDFIRWLGERNLSSDDRVMRLKEGYVKEGSTVSVMGVVQRNDNVLMIVPSPEPVSTGCQWGKFLLPATLEGIVLRCEDTSKADVIPV